MPQHSNNIGSTSPVCVIYWEFPANTIHWPNAELMLARRLRRRPNINPALDQCIVFDGNAGRVYTLQWDAYVVKRCHCNHMVIVMNEQLLRYSRDHRVLSGMQITDKTLWFPGDLLWQDKTYKIILRKHLGYFIIESYFNDKCVLKKIFNWSKSYYLTQT